MSSAPDAALDVMDVLGGFASLEKRSPTLDGAVPLRVAQGCVPLLAGNSFGWQVTLRDPVRARKSLGRWVIAAPEALTAALGAVTPVLLARGVLAEGSAAHLALARGLVSARGGLVAQGRISLFTGLLVRARPGVRLRVASCANRRNTSFTVRDAVLPETLEWTALVLEFTASDDASEVLFAGEVASVMALAPHAPWSEKRLADAPQAGRAHVDFYDEAYFAAKRGTVTRKYRRLVADESLESHAGGAELIVAGDVAYKIEEIARGSEGVIAAMCFANAVGFRVRWDGHTVEIDPDAGALARKAEGLRALWTGVYGEGFVTTHWRAMLYLTKYFTPHPAGEGHFFVKPFGFVTTPPGWSCVIEGACGAGYDVMRGVVSTDVFHAVPAVFQLHRMNDWIAVAEGAWLMRVIPVPRRLIAAGLSRVPFRVA